jgi:CBS domain-containing protein/SAM-dependent methyltransferase
MKVSDVMHRSVVTVTKDVSLKEVGRLIFSLGMAGIPVVKGKKLVGVVTEQVILSRMHPTIQDLIDDYIHAKDFDSMAKSIHEVLDVPAGEAMETNVMTIGPDSPVMLAHSEMQMNKFNRLPVVNDNHELVGVISQGDIFRAILKDEIPQVEKDRYAGFVSKYYDQMIDWQKRYDSEFPALFEIFENKNVKKILELGTWTGEYAIELAKRSNYSVLGADSTPVMVKISNEKKAKLPKDVRSRVEFAVTDYINTRSLGKEKFDAVISMGNHLAYNPLSLNDLFKNLSKVMSNKAVVIIHLLNFDKILKSKNRLLNFGINKANEGGHRREQLFIEFFDHKNESSLLQNTIIFDYDGINWIYKGITTIEMRNIKEKEIENVFRKVGFKKISFFGSVGEYRGEYEKLSLESPFDPLKSDWMTVVAER